MICFVCAPWLLMCKPISFRFILIKICKTILVTQILLVYIGRARATSGIVSRGTVNTIKYTHHTIILYWTRPHFLSLTANCKTTSGMAWWRWKQYMYINGSSVFKHLPFANAKTVNSHSNCCCSYSGKTAQSCVRVWVSTFVTGNSIKISSNLICFYSLLENVCVARDVWALNCCHCFDMTSLVQTNLTACIYNYQFALNSIWIDFFSVNRKLLKSLSMAPLLRTPHTHRK